MNSRPEPSSETSRSETVPSCDAVDDAQRLHLAAVPVRERAVVVARGERLVHALEPAARGSSASARRRQATASAQRRAQRSRSLLRMLRLVGIVLAGLLGAGAPRPARWSCKADSRLRRVSGEEYSLCATT